MMRLRRTDQILLVNTRAVCRAISGLNNSSFRRRAARSGEIARALIARLHYRRAFVSASYQLCE